MRSRGSTTIILLAISAAALSVAQAAQAEDYPAFCQGIAIQGAQNRMFVSTSFPLALKAAPESGPLRDTALGSAFAAEVKTRSGQTLLDYSCYARTAQAELDGFIESTLKSNQSAWTVERVEWNPAAPAPAPVAASAPTSSGAPGPAPAPAARATALSLDLPPPTRATPQAPPPPPAPTITPAVAPRPEPAPHVAPAAPVASPAKPPPPAAPAVTAAPPAMAATATVERQVDLNADQERAATATRLQFEAQQRAYEDSQRAYLAQQKAFEEQQRAYRAAQSAHQAEVKAAADARKKWEADVAACLAGDRTRCTTEATPGAKSGS